MKISISLPEEDVRFIDEYGARADAPSRSAVIHEAVTMLRSAGLEASYTAAFDEWGGSEDAAYWDASTSDGLADAQG